jgi:hypothetical protein
LEAFPSASWWCCLLQHLGTPFTKVVDSITHHHAETLQKEPQLEHEQAIVLKRYMLIQQNENQKECLQDPIKCASNGHAQKGEGLMDNLLHNMVPHVTFDQF